MRARALALAVSVFVVPVVASVVAERPAYAGTDRDKSPAKKQIADLEYMLKDVARLRNLENLPTNKGAQNALDSSMKDCQRTLADLKKADPSWDVTGYESALKGANDALEAAKKGGPPPPPSAPAGANKAGSAAFNSINMVEVEMKATTRKLTEPAWDDDSDKVRHLGEELDSLDGYIAKVKKEDPSWNITAYQQFSKDARVKYDAAKTKVAAKQKDSDDSVRRAAQWSNINDRWGQAIRAAANTQAGKAPSNLSPIKDAVGNLKALDGLAKECQEFDYPKLQAKFASEPIEKQPAKVCALANDQKNLLKAFVPLAAKAYVDGIVAADKASVDKLKAEGYMVPLVMTSLQGADAYVTKAAEDFATATKDSGSTVDKSTFEPLKTNVASFAAALTEASSKSRFDKDFAAQEAGATASATAQAGAMKAALVKVRTAGAEWSISKNDIGIPKSKWQRGGVLLKVGKESFCRYYHVTFSATYTGGGTYGKPFTNDVASHLPFYVSTCN